MVTVTITSLREPQPSPKGGTDTEVKDRGSPLAGSPLEPLLRIKIGTPYSGQKDNSAVN